MSERNLQILGWAGTCLSVIMYVSYVPNIMANLDGNKVPFLQPLAAAINCTIWVSYAFKVQKGLSARRSKFPGDHLWATNRNNGALNRAFNGLINFKIARAVSCLPRPQRFLVAYYAATTRSLSDEPELAYRKRAGTSQIHYNAALKFCKIARAAFKSAEFK